MNLNEDKRKKHRDAIGNIFDFANISSKIIIYKYAIGFVNERVNIA